MADDVTAAVEYTKPGQKAPTPSPGSGDRVFYESLFREKPTSEMALKWCIEHGVFFPEEQAKLYKDYLKVVERQKAGRGGALTSPVR